MRYSIVLLFFIAVLLFYCSPKSSDKVASAPSPTAEDNLDRKKKAKNVILLIGDGMGLAQITAGMYSNGNETVLEDFPVVGLHKSHAFDKLVTDSAAGATAFACGKKTYNGAIAVDQDSLPIPTILEEAEQNGLSTGLIATSTIVHATPASFIAHNKSRRNYEEIAADFLDTEIDFFVGGGLKFFNRRENDERNLISEFRAKGYVMDNYFDNELNKVIINPSRNFGFLTADKDPLPVAQGRDYLVQATQMGLAHLDKHGKDGFFLMVEGSQIDWGGHANNSNYIITEFIEFDEAINAALNFAKIDKNTLVVVTADHETGGYAIQSTSRMDSLVTAFTSDYHTGVMIPVFAYGPGSEEFAGIYENTEIYNKMRAAFGWR